MGTQIKVADSKYKLVSLQDLGWGYKMAIFKADDLFMVKCLFLSSFYNSLISSYFSGGKSKALAAALPFPS